MCIDQAIHERPQFISRTRDKAVLLSESTLCSLLSFIKFDCQIQKDGEAFVITNEIISDIITSGETEELAKEDLCRQLLEYAEDYYTEFGLYSRSPNRKEHPPYVMLFLTLGSPDKLMGILQCRAGKN